MTPYAALLCKPSDSDEAIRKAYHRLAEAEHPDRNNGEPGPLWHAATEAYNQVKTDALRASWAASSFLLSGQCAACNGSGVAGTRMFKGSVRACAACGGEGRKK